MKRTPVGIISDRSSNCLYKYIWSSISQILAHSLLELVSPEVEVPVKTEDFWVLPKSFDSVNLRGSPQIQIFTSSPGNFPKNFCFFEVSLTYKIVRWLERYIVVVCCMYTRLRTPPSGSLTHPLLHIFIYSTYFFFFLVRMFKHSSQQISVLQYSFIRVTMFYIRSLDLIHVITDPADSFISDPHSTFSKLLMCILGFVMPNRIFWNTASTAQL